MPQPPWERDRHRHRGAGLPLPLRPEVSPRGVEGPARRGGGRLLLFTTYYQVEPEEVGRRPVLRRLRADERPRAHLKLPFGIERVTKVRVQRQLKMEFGFRTGAAGGPVGVATPPEAQAESIMLTGDLNVAVVEWIVQFRIRDPKAYLFHIRDVPETFRYMSEAAVRQVVATTASTR